MARVLRPAVPAGVRGLRLVRRPSGATTASPRTHRRRCCSALVAAVSASRCPSWLPAAAARGRRPAADPHRGDGLLPARVRRPAGRAARRSRCRARSWSASAPCTFPLILHHDRPAARRTPAGTAALSGSTSQRATCSPALGPFAVGAIYERTGGWTWPPGAAAGADARADHCSAATPPARRTSRTSSTRRHPA